MEGDFATRKCHPPRRRASQLARLTVSRCSLFMSPPRWRLCDNSGHSSPHGSSGSGSSSCSQRQWHLAAAAVADISDSSLRQIFYSDFRNRKTISLNKHLMQRKGRRTGFPPKYSVEERKVSTFVASLATLATSRARHKWQLSTDNTDCYSTSTSAWQLQMAEGHIDVSFCPSDYGSMCIKLAKINYKTGLSN